LNLYAKKINIHKTNMIKLEKLNGELMQMSFSGKKYHYTNSLLYNVHVNCAMIRLSMKIA